MVKQTRTKTFEERYFDQLEKSFNEANEKVDENSKAMRAGFNQVNQRIGRIEKKVFAEVQPTPAQLPAFYRDPAIQRILIYIAAGIVLLLLTAKGIDIQKVGL